MAARPAVTVPTAVDVAVVGGGPGGAAVAIGCARAGLDCLLVDAGPGPGTRPGETLHPGVDVVLRGLGAHRRVAGAGFLRHAGHWVEWGGPPAFHEFGADADGPWRGYQARRDVLDPMLVDVAEQAGARVLHGCRALRPLTGDPSDGTRVTGLVTTAGACAASVVVDAGGRRHWLARRLRCRIRRVSPTLVVAYGHTTGPVADAPRLRADAGGWTWTAPVAADTTAWVRLRLDPDPGRWGRPPAGVDGPPAGPPRGADVTWRRVDVAAGPGWFLVGDAAAVVDPAASHGVLRALVSGAVAARAITDRAAGLVAEDEAAGGYTRWIADRFDHDVHRLRDLYRIFPSWPAA